MIHIKTLLKFIAVVGCVFMLPAAQAYEESGFTPGWVSGDCASFWNGKLKDRVCATGAYSGSTDIAELRRRAIETAKKEVAQELEARVQAVVEHYGKSHHGHDDFGNPPDLKLMKKASRQITNDAMQLSEINGFWITPENEVCVLVSLTTTGFDDAVGRMGHLSDELRKEVHKRVEQIIEHVQEHLMNLLKKEAEKLIEKEIVR